MAYYLKLQWIQKIKKMIKKNVFCIKYYLESQILSFGQVTCLAWLLSPSPFAPYVHAHTRMETHVHTRQLQKYTKTDYDK